MIAALFVARGGCYWDLHGVDPWDQERDARLYPGPWPVVCHSPCARWCRLAGLVEARWGHKRGDDGGCFASALASVRRWGGVLEHPAYSDAWAAFDLPMPALHGWQRGLCGGWATQVDQARYGHRARKATWLYAFGTDLPLLDWGRTVGTVWISWCANHNAGRVVERMGKKERSATPLAFRDLLLDIARSARSAGDERAAEGVGKP